MIQQMDSTTREQASRQRNVSLFDYFAIPIACLVAITTGREKKVVYEIFRSCALRETK